MTPHPEIESGWRPSGKQANTNLACATFVLFETCVSNDLETSKALSNHRVRWRRVALVLRPPRLIGDRIFRVVRQGPISDPLSI